MNAIGSRQLSLVLMTAFACQLLVPAAAYAVDVTIPVGTKVQLSFDQPLSPETTSVGQSVNLSVDEDVVIDGTVVIEAGAPATGEVTESEEPGAIGKPAKILVQAGSVEAIDGTTVPLSGRRLFEGEDKQTETLIITILCCVLGLILKGGEVDIPAGATLEACVDAETVVST